MATSAAGLNDQLTYYEFELDSAEFSSTTDQFISPLNWPTFSLLGNRQLTNVAAMKILEVQIRYSWHEINAKQVSGGFTTSKITFTDTVLGTTAPITLVVGSYTEAQFATAFQTALNAAAAALGSPNTYTIAYSGITGDYTITRTAGANGWRISVAADATFYTSWFWKAGMPIGYVSPISGASLTLPLHSCAPTYLYVNSTRLAPLFNTWLPARTIGGTKGAQIAKVPINAAKGNVIHWQDPAPDYWFNFDNAPTLTTADFFLTIGPTNNVSDLLDLNGCSFSLKLGVLLFSEQQQLMYQSGAMKLKVPSMF